MENSYKLPAGFKRWVAYLILVTNVCVVAGVWLANLLKAKTLNVSSGFLAVGHIAGMLSALAILIELLLMARVNFLEDAFGSEELTIIHKWNGYASFGLLFAHIVFTTIGYQFTGAGSTFAHQIVLFITNFEDVLKAVLAFGLLVGVTWLSASMVRKHLPYEVWYFVHLSAYLAVLLAFGHQLKVGPDFIAHPLFVYYWWALYIAVAALVAWYRFGAIVMAYFWHSFKVVQVRPETPDTVTMRITGNNMKDFKYQAGQFATWHIFTSKLWWQWHPFSFSSAPGTDYIDTTVKASGDYTKQLLALKPGTRIAIDGPHGKFTDELRSKNKVLYIAGGVGVTPLYSMLQQNAGKLDIVLLYACQTPKDVAFRQQLASYSKMRGIRVYCFFSKRPRNGEAYVDQNVIKKYAPDFLERDVYVCGPAAMMKSVKANLKLLGQDPKLIHSEKFEF